MSVYILKWTYSPVGRSVHRLVTRLLYETVVNVQFFFRSLYQYLYISATYIISKSIRCCCCCCLGQNVRLVCYNKRQIKSSICFISLSLFFLFLIDRCIKLRAISRALDFLCSLESFLRSQHFWDTACRKWAS